MTHSEVFGWMIKRIVELGEYDIEYKPRVAIKAQALSDFLSEMVQPNEEEAWRVFMYGASSLAGCGVGVLIISPPGEKIKLALRIDARVTNNEAEYEVVLAGIRAAWEVGASRIILYSNSQLITQQIRGVYEAKDDRMLKYLQLIRAQAEIFADWSIEPIPRGENGEENALAKMAASFSEVSTREVLHVSLLILSTEEEILPAPEDSWMTPLIKFIMNKELSVDKAQAQKIKRQAPRWLTLSQDSARVVQACEGCQHHSNFQHSPDTLMKHIWASSPLISVAWTLWGKEIMSWCREMKITQSFTSVAYPQANGQTEVVNRIIVQALKNRLQGKGKDWVEELPSVLWAYRTTPRVPTQETPFNLLYGSEEVLPVEIGQTSSRVESYPDNNDQSRAMELDLVEEKRDQAFIRMEHTGV
ncbi:uncharacterized protein [Primulina eburnea]|uniref:uncharacterized protein n=1 Tax=Primulina eburnea TaxID=1245227 RepID=UPI003C6C55BF